jgi:hypothetical protein
MTTPETVCPTCDGEGRILEYDCPTCKGTGRIPAQGSDTADKPSGALPNTLLDRMKAKPKNSAEAERESTPRKDKPSIPPTPAGEGELDSILIGLVQDTSTLSVGDVVSESFGFVEAKAALNAYIAKRVLEVIGEDEPYAIGKGTDARNELRAEQRQRIAVIKKESQQ